MKPIIQVLCAILACTFLFAQEPPPPPPPSTGQSSSSASPPSGKQKLIPSYLILGTVYNEKALCFPGVRVRIRRTDENKFRWETYTNSRGEFAVRVFSGFKYEVVTHAKKYQDQSSPVDAKVDVQQRLSIKLQPVDQGKAEPKS